MKEDMEDAVEVLYYINQLQNEKKIYFRYVVHISTYYVYLVDMSDIV